jgi:hypothetical protein
MNSAEFSPYGELLCSVSTLVQSFAVLVQKFHKENK